MQKKLETKNKEDIKIKITSTPESQKTDKNDSFEMKPKISHLSHFSKARDFHIESLDDISEKDSVGLPSRSNTTFNDVLSKNNETSAEMKDRKKPNLHIFTQKPDSNPLFFNNFINKKEKRKPISFFQFL